MNVIPGMTFGYLKTKWCWKSKKHNRIWKCTCACGGYCYVKEEALIRNIARDCDGEIHKREHGKIQKIIHNI